MMKMRHQVWLMKRMNNRTVLSAFAIFLALPSAASFSPAAAQVNQQNGPVNRGPIERIAEGKVVDKTGAAIGGAVVYLKDSRTNAVKTYIADDSGHYRFGNLSQNTDYELWAESSGVRSKSKAISSFNSDNHFYFALKVAKAGSLE
jgi:hypothetical protein